MCDWLLCNPAQQTCNEHWASEARNAQAVVKTVSHRHWVIATENCVGLCSVVIFTLLCASYSVNTLSDCDDQAHFFRSVTSCLAMLLLFRTHTCPYRLPWGPEPYVRKGGASDDLHVTLGNVWLTCVSCYTGVSSEIYRPHNEWL